MKLLVNSNAYKGSNVRLEVSTDCCQAEAWSYSWWKFITTDRAGNIIYNGTFYSMSTRRHQSDVLYQLRQLGIRPAISLYNTQANLRDGIEEAVKAEITAIEEIQQSLLAETRKKGTHRRKNEERLKQIEELGYQVKDLQRYLSDYMDRQRLPLSIDRPYWIEHPEFYTEEEIKQNRIAYESYKRSWQSYFLKPNGVLKRNEFNRFWNQFEYTYRSAPTSIDRLLSFFSVKRDNMDAVSTILSYPHVSDLEAQIPDRDSKEYDRLRRRMESRAEPLNLFTLDKLHVYLTNLSIRAEQRDRPIREPLRFPVHPSLEILRDTEGLTILDTDVLLRREGRQMHHCIGGKNYQHMCHQQGYQALNYKGYTFLLDERLQVAQTHGKYNSETPDWIEEELHELIDSVAGPARVGKVS